MRRGLKQTMKYIDHDRLFKELISTFFEEFMLLFFPNVHESMDYNHTAFLSEELYRDILKGEKNRVDLLIETKLKGEDGLIIVHIEPQSYDQDDFNERMFIYFSRLYEKYRKRILPIAIFSYDKIKEEPNLFTVEFPFHQVLNFEFLKVELKKQNWRDYLKQDNPVAAALLSKMGYAKEEKVQVKLEFLRMLTRLELDPARIDLIADIFETYLRLNESEEDKLQAEIRKLNPEEEAKVMEITTSWHEKGMKEGEKKAELKIARKMLEENYDIEQIRKITGLSVEVIKKIMN